MIRCEWKICKHNSACKHPLDVEYGNCLIEDEPPVHLGFVDVDDICEYSEFPRELDGGAMICKNFER
jgi:hypothetical protein